MAQSADTEEKPPPYTGVLRAGDCSNLTALHLFPWLCSPSSHSQSIPAIHTPKNSHLISLNSPCRIQALKSMPSHSVVQQPFQEQSCKQLLNADSRAGKKTFATPSRSYSFTVYQQASVLAEQTHHEGKPFLSRDNQSQKISTDGYHLFYPFPYGSVR